MPIGVDARKLMSETKNTIRSFIVDNFLFGSDEDFDEYTSFLDSGIIDSTGVLELIAFLETEFNIKIDDDELVPENLDSIHHIDAFLRKKMGSSHPELEATI